MATPVLAVDQVPAMDSTALLDTADIVVVRTATETMLLAQQGEDLAMFVTRYPVRRDGRVVTVGLGDRTPLRLLKAGPLVVGAGWRHFLADPTNPSRVRSRLTGHVMSLSIVRAGDVPL